MIPDDVVVVVSSSMLAVFVGNEPKLASAGKIECDTMMSTLHNQNEIWGLLFLQLIFTATMWDILNALWTIVWVSSQGNLKHDFSCFSLFFMWVWKTWKRDNEENLNGLCMLYCYVLLPPHIIICVWIFHVDLHWAELSFCSSHFRNFNNKHANWTMMMPK